MRLYFVRHGESTANVLGEFSNNGFKHPLTEKGLEQARALAGALSDRRIDRVCSSPVLRAAQTAQVLAERLRVQLEVAEALREWSVGIYEGTTDPAGWALHRQVQEDWFYRQRLDSKMPGGESFIEIRDRFVPFIEGLTRQAGDAGRAVALVAHGGLYLAMLPVIFTNVDFERALQLGLPYTACIVAEARPAGLRCVEWCGAPLGDT